MSRFPSSMAETKSRTPKAKRWIQVRYFNWQGDVLTIEGATSDPAVRQAVEKLIAELSQPSTEKP